jgi:hypothetical protein
MGAPVEMCSCGMARTSITCWLKTAGAGGTESMRQGIRHLKGWKRKRGRPRKVYGKILHQSHLGSGARGINQDPTNIEE